MAGGDGLVHEVITGYFRHPDHENLSRVPVGIIPSGTANAMARELHTHQNQSHVSLVGRAALAAAVGQTRSVDVIKVAYQHTQEDIYALSVFGWGLSGSVALKADQMRKSAARRIPGTKRFRYDIAGFFQVMNSWPQVENGIFEYRDPSQRNERWIRQDLSCVNFIATNMRQLGKGHTIHPDIEPDDGKLGVVWAAANCSRKNLVWFSRQMKKGGYLSNCQKMSSVVVSEFKLTPANFDAASSSNTDDSMAKQNARAPFLIDGDPHRVEPVHVQVTLRHTLHSEA